MFNFIDLRSRKNICIQIAPALDWNAFWKKTEPLSAFGGPVLSLLFFIFIQHKVKNRGL